MRITKKPMEPTPERWYITLDQEDIKVMIADYLIKLGHANPGFKLGETVRPWSKDKSHKWGGELDHVTVDFIVRQYNVQPRTSGL